MDYDLKGKKVLVQGASSGLGFAIAKAYAAEGCVIAISSSNEKKIQDAASKIKGAKAFVADFYKEGAGASLVWQVVEQLGGIDILVTNTTNPTKGEFHSLKTEDWQKGFQSIYMSAIESILEASHSMIKNNFGRIIMSSSFAAKEPISTLTISSSLRSGLLGLAKTLSHQFARHNITVNALLPGYISTEMVLKRFKDNIEDIEQEIPMKRMGTPEEYAGLALFLGSKNAGYITGQAICIDGGLTQSI